MQTKVLEKMCEHAIAFAKELRGKKNVCKDFVFSLSILFAIFSHLSKSLFILASYNLELLSLPNNSIVIK